MCPDCVDIHLGIDTNINKCKIHGRDYIEWKCKYCCSIAIWFCGGTTHYCDPCHSNHNGILHKKKHQLPKCKGKKFCPLKIDHPHFEEFNLGCGLCRHNVK